MQVNNIAPITLIYPDAESREIWVFTSLNWVPINYYKVSGDIKKPYAFKWPNSNYWSITPELINWLQTDFKQMFDYDQFMWMASVATVDPKLQPYLKDLFNE